MLYWITLEILKILSNCSNVTWLDRWHYW